MFPDSLKSRRWAWAAVVAWGGLVASGFALLNAYAARPGDAGDPAQRWPASSSIRPDGRRPTLLVFLHPRCPCSRATVSELGRLLARCRGAVACRIVVFRPRTADAGWKTFPGADELARHAGVAVVADPDGVEAKRFGVTTSGHVLLYRTDGRLAFAGGITPGRGHEGDSMGRDALIERIHGESESSRTCSPVFGCAIIPEGVEREANGERPR